MLIWRNSLYTKFHTLFEWWKLLFAFLISILAFNIKNCKTIKIHTIARCLKNIISCKNFCWCCLMNTIRHLTSNKTLPNNFIKLILFWCKAILNLIRWKLYCCWTNSFVSVLSVWTRFILSRFRRKILISPSLLNIISCTIKCVIRKS